MGELQNKTIHFTGIGGISMSALAFMHLDSGGNVTGSDINEKDILGELSEKGAEIWLEHSSQNIKGQDILVYSSAIPTDNVELETARKQKIPCLSRAEFLARMAKKQNMLAVTGTHGKTTTTALLADIFVKAKRDPSVMLGGELDIIEGNYRLGGGEYFIAEADESDGSLLNYCPYIGIITNIEEEHLDYYDGEKEILGVMKQFIDNLENDGKMFICSDDPLSRGHLLDKDRSDGRKIITFGLNSGDYRIKRIESHGFKTEFELKDISGKNMSFTLNLPGRHNVLNAMAALGAARSAGIDWGPIRRSLKSFSGVKRRFENKGEINGITIIDDYAHHPTEIFAVFQTAISLDFSRIITVFQPHRYTRTEALWDDFVDTLSRFSNLLICDIYPANQDPIFNINSRRLAEEIASARQVQEERWVEYAGNVENASKKLSSRVREGDLVLTLGAGDVYRCGEILLEELSGTDEK